MSEPPRPWPPPRPPRACRATTATSRSSGRSRNSCTTEAELLDERRFKEWLDTLADDLRYFMPMDCNVRFGEHATRENTTREKEMSWFNEGKWTLAKRVEQILTGVHWAEEPLSRVCRMVSNVQLTAIETNAAGERGGGRLQPLPGLPEPLRVRAVLLRRRPH